MDKEEELKKYFEYKEKQQRLFIKGDIKLDEFLRRIGTFYREIILVNV